MNKGKTVIVNGRVYDEVTGLPLSTTPKQTRTSSKTAATPARPRSAVARTAKDSPAPAKTVHATMQRSRTLRRDILKKPVQQQTTPKKPTARTMDIAKSSSISRFVREKPTAPQAPKQEEPTLTAKSHPIVRKVARTLSEKKRPAKVAATSSAEIKQQAIENAMSAPTPKLKQPKEKKPLSRQLKMALVTVGALIVTGFGLWVAYTYVPMISVYVASSQAGVQASYPGFIPDGYRFKGPVAFNDNEVAITFKSNSNETLFFTLKQTTSTWDSSAVQENLVEKNSGEDILPIEDGGRKIFIYNSNQSAAWINGGILFTITGNVPLDPAQVRRIAASL